MRKALKILAYVVGIILIVVLGFVAYVSFSATPTYDEVSIPDLSVPITPDGVERGLELVTNNCQGCHHGDGTNQLTGRLFDDKNANQAFGDIYTANITKHPEAGIGQYTDGELYRLLRTGVKKNGEKAIAVMPAWPLAAEQDIHDMIAFLRSGHSMVAASDKVHPVHQPSFLEKALTRMVFRPTPYQDSYPQRPALGDSVAYGAYLINNVNLCYYCHSENIETANALVPKETPGYLGGGFVYRHLDYDLEVPSLLMDGESNISSWTAEQFVDAVKFGIRPDQPAYKEPMHPYNLLDTAEVRAIYLYLKDISQ